MRLRILLCRSCRIDKWGPGSLDWPMWRFYWNATPGAHVLFEGRTYDLGPSHWMLIPPLTPATGRQTAPFEHFFVHFALGAGHRLKQPELFTGRLGGQHRALIDALTEKIRSESPTGPVEGFEVQQIVLRALSRIPPDRWRPPVGDARIRHALVLIESHLRRPLTNAEVAHAVGLHPKSFVRLFHGEVGIPPQQYAMELRVDHACEQLLRDNVSVETAADTWGFSDRSHLTRAMARHRGTTPGRLRRRVF